MKIHMLYTCVFLLAGLLALFLYSETGQRLAVAICSRQNLSGLRWHASKFWHDPNPFPACTMDSCFNFSRCAAQDDFRIYVYGAPYHPTSYFTAFSKTPWVTTDPTRACIFLVLEQDHHSLLPYRPHPSTLPHWNGGLNHVIATLADRWWEVAIPSLSLGNASVLASCLQENEYRPGFDISIPLAGIIHPTNLQRLRPWERKYFLTFKGTRYLGEKEGNFRSEPAFRSNMHNGNDVVVAVTCRHTTNDRIRLLHPKQGKGCDEDEKIYNRYNFEDLLNSTFGLAPAGRSPSSHRMVEILSAGAIPVVIADNHVKPFDSLIQWHRCILQFPTTEMERILPALRAMTRNEMVARQRYCVHVYHQYLKDDATIVRSLVRALHQRFWGMFSRFNESDQGTMIGGDQGS